MALIPRAPATAVLLDRLAGVLPGWASRVLRAAARNPPAVEALADQAVVSITNFATGVIIGRSCTREQFGLYALAFVVVTGLIDLQATLISAPYTVYRPRLDAEAARVYTGATLLFQAAFSLATLVVLMAAAGALHTGSGGLSPVLTALGLTVAFVLAKENLRRVFFAALRMRQAFALDAVVGVAQLGVLLLMARAGMLTSATTAIVAVGAASGTVAIGWLLLNRHEYSLARQKAMASLRAMWKLGRWMSASGILWNVTAQFYPWLLATRRGSAATALWAACSSVTSVVNPAVLALNNYLAPAAATAFALGGIARLRRIVLTTSALFVAAVAPFCVVMVFFGDRVVSFLYGEAYAHDGVVVSLLALNLVPIGVSLVASRGLFAVERADLDFQINLVPFAVMVAAGFWLIDWYGVEGAAAATLAGTSAGAVLRVAAFLSQSRGKQPERPVPESPPAIAAEDAPPLASVVIPAFNAERHIEAAIVSALRQSHPRIEVIVVDDGSTDATPAVLRTFGAAITVVRQENRGRSAARNRGLEEASGEFVVFLDADDLLEPDHLATLVAACEDGPHDLAYGRAEGFLDGDTAKRVRVRRRCVDGDRAVDIVLDDFISINSAVVRRSFAARAGTRFRRGLRCGEDWEFWIRLVLAGARVKFVDRVLALNREHAGNTRRDLVAMDQDLPALISQVESDYRDEVERRGLAAHFERSRTRIRFRLASARVFLGFRREGRRDLIRLRRSLALFRPVDLARLPAVFLLSVLPIRLPASLTRIVFGQHCALVQRVGRRGGPTRAGESDAERGPRWGRVQSA